MSRRPPPLPSGPGIIETVLTLAGLLGLEYLLTRWLPGGGSPLSAPALYRNALLRSIEISALLLWWRLRGRSFSDFGFSWEKAPRGVALGLFASILLLGLSYVVEIAFLKAGWGSFYQRVVLPRRATVALGPLILAGAVIAPIFEELIFRGLFYGALRRRWGVLLSMAVTVATFALAHLPNEQIPWAQAVGGIAFCLALEYAQNLWTPTVLHALGNLVLFTLAYAL